MKNQKINLGCGLNVHENWVNLDASWNARLARHKFLRRLLKFSGLLPKNLFEANWPQNMVFHDVKKNLPFKSGHFYAAYASHLLEHLYFKEAKKLLSECFRILKPGGVIRIVVPDIRGIIEEYNENKRKNSLEASNILSNRIFIWDSSPYSKSLIHKVFGSFNDFHSHKWMYDAEFLIKLLSEAGFEGVKEMEYLESRISEIGEVEKADRILSGEGICVEGIKAKS